jgi:hypothetical protein
VNGYMGTFRIMVERKAKKCRRNGQGLNFDSDIHD